MTTIPPSPPTPGSTSSMTFSQHLEFEASFPQRSAGAGARLSTSRPARAGSGVASFQKVATTVAIYKVASWWAKRAMSDPGAYSPAEIDKRAAALAAAEKLLIDLTQHADQFPKASQQQLHILRHELFGQEISDRLESSLDQMLGPLEQLDTGNYPWEDDALGDYGADDPFLASQSCVGETARQGGYFHRRHLKPKTAALLSIFIAGLLLFIATRFFSFTTIHYDLPAFFSRPSRPDFRSILGL